MKKQPTVAVLLATFNGEKHLKQQLDSIFSQTYQNFKIYISDDCSDDHTLEIIRAYQEKYPENFFYTSNEKNIGYVRNFEKLLNMATEEYLAFSDQDDIWSKNKLELQMKEMLTLEKRYENRACLVHSDLEMIDEEGKRESESYFRYRSYKLKPFKDLGHILGPCGVMGNTMLFNKKLKNIALPFPNQLDSHDYWLAVNNELFGVRKTINNSLVQYRIHRDNVSNSRSSLQKKQFHLLQRNFRLPNLETKRRLYLPKLLNSLDSSEDGRILKAYINYLNFKGNRVKIYFDLVRFSLIKRDIFIRVKIFFKLLLTNRYKSEVRAYMNFKKLDISIYIYNLLQVSKSKHFKGWGRKKTGRFALWCHKKFGGSLTLQEDGFIRSLGLAVDGYPSFSLVEDDVGIYYDATAPSKLENILNEYDFQNDTKLMNDARDAIDLIVKHKISKYNNAKNIDENYFKTDEDRVLVIAQTQGDASLEYGMLGNFTTDDMLNAAVSENPNSKVYLKIHPDVLSGKKKSDIDIDSARKMCTIIEEDVNPISLLEHFSKVYTKTSGMGFEALLVGCECVCFGMPFYAGWGVTIDKSQCSRRKAKRSVEEIFAAAYILYTRYHNPYTNKASDIFDTIETIIGSELYF